MKRHERRDVVVDHDGKAEIDVKEAPQLIQGGVSLWRMGEALLVKMDQGLLTVMLVGVHHQQARVIALEGLKQPRRHPLTCRDVFRRDLRLDHAVHFRDDRRAFLKMREARRETFHVVVSCWSIAWGMCHVGNRKRQTRFSSWKWVYRRFLRPAVGFESKVSNSAVYKQETIMFERACNSRAANGRMVRKEVQSAIGGFESFKCTQGTCV